MKGTARRTPKPGVFAFAITFTGREIARILHIGSVHGKFYKRRKMARDRNHGGRLWATANDGPGTMFHFTVPNCQGEQNARAAAA